MRLVEAYALQAGVKIGPMLLQQSFIPLGVEGPYIVMISGTGAPNKSYSHYGIVAEMLRKHAGLPLVQVGMKDEKRIGADKDFCGKTTIPQYNWIIANAALVICGDTSALHIAGHYNVPVVSLFAISDPRVSGSYFGDETKKRYLVPPDYKPTYTLAGGPESIDKIKPEAVAAAALELLGKPKTKLSVTKHIGSNVYSRQIELVPNCVVAANFLADHSLVIRFDLAEPDKDQFVYEQIKRRPCEIVTDKPLNLEILGALRQNIRGLFYIVDKHGPEFSNQLTRKAFPHTLLTRKQGEEFDAIKLDYIDCPFLKQIKTETVVLDVSDRFMTSKKVVADGKMFLSLAHWKSGQPAEGPLTNVGNVIDSPEFFENLSHYYIYGE